MEFWGLEVKPGSTVKCEPGHGFILHLSQAALGESKKSDNALMYVKVDGQKLAIGTLSIDKYPQIQFDLVFDKEFELSHTSKTTSVFFSGYKVEQPMEEDEMDFDSEDEEEELNVPVIKEKVIKENGKADGKEQKSQEKAVAAASKSSLSSKKSKDDDDSDEDETDDSDEDETDDSDEGEGLSPEEGDDDDSSDEDEDDMSDDEEEDTPTPKKPEAGKKRPAENSVMKTPLSDKKAKVAIPSAQKTGGKKGAVHVATPHPAKGKTPANNDKSKEKSPKSGGSVPCKSCTKTFNSEMALQAHSKAKHGAK